MIVELVVLEYSEHGLEHRPGDVARVQIRVVRQKLKNEFAKKKKAV
jgi:hypothetical protein